jgi:hypothetical protein
MPYSSKKQEEFYKPYRIMVLTMRSAWSRDGYGGYSVVIVDTVKLEIASTWYTNARRWNRSHGSWPGSTSRVRFEKNNHGASGFVIVGNWTHLLSKEEWKEKAKAEGVRRPRPISESDNRQSAITVAKQQAIALSLPFDLKKDIMKIDEWQQGPVQPCLLCGEPNKRGHTQTVCGNCVSLYKVGVAIQQGREDSYFVEGQLPDPLGWDDFDRLVKKLIDIAGSEEPKYIKLSASRIKEYKDRVIDPVGRADTGAPAATRHTKLTKQERQAICRTIQQVIDITKDAYTHGLRRGGSVLRSLASNDTAALKTFEKMQVERARETQHGPGDKEHQDPK